MKIGLAGCVDGLDWIKGLRENGIKIATEVLGLKSWVSGLASSQWGNTADGAGSERENQEFGFRHITLEMSFSHLNGDVR